MIGGLGAQPAMLDGCCLAGPAPSAPPAPGGLKGPVAAPAGAPRQPQPGAVAASAWPPMQMQGPAAAAAPAASATDDLAGGGADEDDDWLAAFAADEAAAAADGAVAGGGGDAADDLGPFAAAAAAAAGCGGASSLSDDTTAAEAPGSPGTATAARPAAAALADDSLRVNVVCGTLRGVLLVARQRVIVGSGARGGEQEVSPTEFERLAGKGHRKRWRNTVRVADEPGRCSIGQFLKAHGYDNGAQQRKRARTDDGAAATAAAPPPPASPPLQSRSSLTAAPAPGALSLQGSLAVSQAEQQQLQQAQQAQQQQQQHQAQLLFLQQQQQLQLQALHALQPAAAAAAAPGAARPLPGDGSEAVAVMAEYLAGARPCVPDGLLPVTAPPSVAGRALDLRALFLAVTSRGGYSAVTAAGRWPETLAALGLGSGARDAEALHGWYLDLLLRFERMFDFPTWLAATGRPSPLQACMSWRGPA